MARVVVDVMLKPEILDPQGRAVQGALGRLGLDRVASVRQGKRFEIEIEGELDPRIEEKLQDLAGSLLSNPVIEDFSIYEESEQECDCDGDGCSQDSGDCCCEGGGQCCSDESERPGSADPEGQCCGQCECDEAPAGDAV